MLALEYKDYFIVNVYVPNLNPHSTPDRLDYRIEWDKAVREYVTKLPKPVIMCGDFNVAREYIDIYPGNHGGGLASRAVQRTKAHGWITFLFLVSCSVTSKASSTIQLRLALIIAPFPLS